MGSIMIVTKKQWIIAGIAALVVILVLTAVNLAGALGRVSVLREQIEEWQDSTAVAHEMAVVAAAAFDSVVVVAEAEEVEAAESIAEAEEEAATQEAAAEEAFRRAQNLAADQPVLQRAIEEMRAEAIVTSMAHEEVERVSAAALLTAQTRIRSLQDAALRERQAHESELFAVNASLTLALQTIEEQQSVIAPSFLTKLLDIPEVALAGAAAGFAIGMVVVGR